MRTARISTSFSRKRRTRATTSTPSRPSRSLLLHSVSLRAPSRRRGYSDRPSAIQSSSIRGYLCSWRSLARGGTHRSRAAPSRVVGPCQHLPCFDSSSCYLRFIYYMLRDSYVLPLTPERIFFLEFSSSVVRRSNSDLFRVIFKLAHKHQYRRVGAVIGRSHPKRQFILTFNSDGP